ncbi:hypothetical protein EJB05_07369, partial [Eragrostis curvula]
MASASPNAQQSLYPQVEQSHPEFNPFHAAPGTAASSSLYPTVNPDELAENLFPETKEDDATPPPPTTEETLVSVPGAQLHLVDPDRSLDLGAGTLSVVRLRQGDHSVAVLARLVPEKRHQRRGLFRLFSSGGGRSSGDGAEQQEPVQWPLTRDVAAVKLDPAHYFFSLHVPHSDHDEDKDDAEAGEAEAALSYGLTVAGKGQDNVLAELDRVLEEYTTFSVKQVEAAAKEKSEVMDTRAVAEITPEEAVGDKKELVEEQSAAFWTTIAPNVDDYSSSVARLIAMGSGQLVRGIIWCGDITAEGMRRGEEVVKTRVGPSAKPTQVKPSTLRRMKRARRVTKMSNNVANSILSGVLKVTGFVTSTVINSKPAQKFFKLMPGEVILASLDGFGKIWDAVEVSGKNVMQTSSVVTTSVVTHRYGEQAGEATHNYLHATGNALGAAWAVFKIRKALDPKGNLKKSSVVSQAAHAVAKESISRQKKNLPASQVHRPGRAGRFDTVTVHKKPRSKLAARAGRIPRQPARDDPMSVSRCHLPHLPATGDAVLHLVAASRSPVHLLRLRATHARLLRLLHPSDPSAAHAGVKLIQAYAACGALPAARAVLDSSPEPCTISFNVLLRALTAASLHRDALLLFASMRPRGPACFPDHYTYPLALKSCAASRDLLLGLQIHSSVAKLRLEANSYVAHSAITMYARCGCPDDAYRVFDEMQRRDVVSWNAMISGFARAGLHDRAVGLFREFVALQCSSPDEGTLASILPAMGNAKAEDIALVRTVFDAMQYKELISWNAMLSIYANNGYHVKAVELFMRMEKDGVEPDSMAFATVLPTCGELSALSLGKQIHEVIERKRMRPNLLLENALIDMYAGCGCLKDAREVFDSMSERDVISWTSMISAYGKHGHGREAVDLFEKMRGQGLKPDSITFVAVLAACSNAGLLDVGKRYFDCMTSRYHITPKAEHYACMVYLLGRAGCINEAYDFIMKMPIEPNERVWGSLLGACRIHSNMDIGLVAADKLFRLVPEKTGYYVLLSNIYARAGRWEDVTSVRNVMASKGIKKLPGASNVEHGDRVHTFHIGDRSHPQSEMIYQKLDELLGKIRGMGYKPEVDATLHDVEEEDKEGHLSVHSEKLAIAFLLINTSPGMPIRVTMNLRTCNDCHLAAKLISTITSREIILKDTNRIHHIAQGVCSCGDYW